MTKTLFAAILLAAMLCANTISAQKKATRKASPVVVEDEPSEADLLYDDMLLSTEQILVVDSVVVGKAEFLQYIPLSREAGELSRYKYFFDTDRKADNMFASDQPNAFTFVNAFGNSVLFSMDSGNGMQLYAADRLDGIWDNMRQVSFFGNEFTDMNFPFMMPDGVTLYFAAKGSNSVGGYDIFVTMYDVETGQFNTPENIGLPYNSKANDYYCAIDEYHQLGYLATDREQADGNVCIYTFVPSDTRTVYPQDMDEEKLKSFAELKNLRATWTSTAKLQAARERIEALKSLKAEDNSIHFVINDQTVYRSVDDFRVAANRDKFNRLCQMQQAEQQLNDDLEDARIQYAIMSAQGNDQTAAAKQTAKTILNLESSLEKQRRYIHEMEKEIRNAEILSAK